MNKVSKKNAMRKAAAALFAICFLMSCSRGERQTGPTVAYLQDLEVLGNNLNVNVQDSVDSVKRDHPFTYSVYKSKTDDEMKKNASAAIAKGGLVFVTSYSADKALRDILTEDDEAIGVTIGSSDQSKILCRMTIRYEEAAFFAGIIAAKETKTGIVAYLGGYQNTLSDPYMAGFTAGAKTVRENIKVYNEYVLSYNSPARASQLIEKMADKGVDTIFADCGASIIGIEGTHGAEGIKVICSNSYRYESDKVVAYLDIDLRPIVREMATMFLDGSLRRGDEYSYGLDNRVFSYELLRVQQATKDEVDTYKVIFFEFGTDLPRNKQELESFDFKYLRSVQLEGTQSP